MNLQSPLCLKILGHEKAADIFQKALTNRMHHAWLIAGASGIGKFNFARHCALHVLSQGQQKIGQLDPTEKNCQLLMAGAHPNVRYVSRPVDEKTGLQKSEIIVQSIRDLKNVFQHTSADGAWRIAIIREAETMNRNAANALLKILEEPPERSLIFLTTTSLGMLLPTIRSRCSTLQLEALDDKTMRGVMAERNLDFAPDDVAFILNMAGGSPGKAQRLMESEAVLEYRNLLSLLQTPVQERLPAIQSFVAGMDKERFRLIAEFMSSILERIIKLASIGELKEFLAGEGQFLRALAVQVSLTIWFQRIEEFKQQMEQAEYAALDRRLVMMNNLNNILSR